MGTTSHLLQENEGKVGTNRPNLGRTTPGLLLTSYGGRMMEWKRVKGWESYEVSNTGELRGKRGLLTLSKLTRGYGYHICENGKKSILTKSSLMREHFPYEWIKNLDDDEEVKPIRGCPGYYITTKGRVWSDKTYDFLTPSPQGSYYWVVRCWNGTKWEKCYIHQLVGRHFLPWEEGLCVLHKDEELPFPEINFLSNFFLGTMEDNSKDNRNKNRQGQQKLTWDDVRSIRKSLSEKTKTPKELSQNLMVSLSTIYDIWKERTWRPL